MDDKRLGRQTSTISVILPLTKTLGNEAVEMYDRSDRSSMEWQQRLVYDIMAEKNGVYYFSGKNFAQILLQRVKIYVIM